MLDGDWPALDVASPVPLEILELIKAEGNGTAISSCLGYLSVGHFYIDTGLRVPHDTQRPIISSHADQLREDFGVKGILRTESPGVVIGLGEGWYSMKNNGPKPFIISKSSPHLHHLSESSGGPVGEIIRGGHRTEAIRHYSHLSDASHEDYW
jgi:hypothetical protein